MNGLNRLQCPASLTPVRPMAIHETFRPFGRRETPGGFFLPLFRATR